MNPVKVLLSGNLNIRFYEEAIRALGGIPLLNDPRGADGSYDGLLLCGGADIDPSHYGESMNGARGTQSLWDSTELSILDTYVRAGKPILGICRGHQLINVFFGGSLHQDIPEADLHIKKNGIDQVHRIVAQESSIPYRFYGREFSVNSAHHQAIKVLGHGLRATAFWEETHIEAIEHTSLPIFGVQWHPERMCFGQAREDTVDGARLFEYFLSLCGT